MPIESQRLIIRCFAQDDEAAVAGYLTEPTVMTFVEGGAIAPAEVSSWIRANSGIDAHEFAIAIKETGQVVGHLILHTWFAAETYELGWVIAPMYQRRGYGSEAAKAAMDYAFSHLMAHRVIATCQPENVASWGVMERIGMRREGHFQACIKRDTGEWWDEYFYATLRHEWVNTGREACA